MPVPKLGVILLYTVTGMCLEGNNGCSTVISLSVSPVTRIRLLNYSPVRATNSLTLLSAIIRYSSFHLPTTYDNFSFTATPCVPVNFHGSVQKTNNLAFG